MNRKRRYFFLAIWSWIICSASVGPVFGVGGSLTLILQDETSDQKVISRVEFYRGVDPDNAREKPLMIRQTVPAGIGHVVDRSVLLELPDGPYRFRILRGPEYRVISGTFELEKTSLDEKTMALPRMVHMALEGWISGDCCVVPAPESVPLRMASEDLHVAAVLGDQTAKPIPRRDRNEPLDFDPIWIRTDVRCDRGLVYYGIDDPLSAAVAESKHALQSLATAATDIAATDQDQHPLRIGIENPFAWELPVWLASGKIDGLFVLGDWLRLDRKVLSQKEGRMPESFSLADPTQMGRYAEQIYRHALDAGIGLVPLAGGGDQSADLPLGYNRLYVSQSALDPSASQGDDPLDQPSSPSDAAQWWQGVWSGRSVATNGPLLRPLVGGKLPGHVFRGRAGETLRIQPELNLAVRDPVEYLEVIHNNRIHYSARLQEFASTGGVIPPIMANESGWVIIRLMTLHEDHYRAAITAPWWIEFDGQRRVSTESVAFFREWLADYETRLKRLPPQELATYVPFIQAARRFWESR